MRRVVSFVVASLLLVGLLAVPSLSALASVPLTRIAGSDRTATAVAASQYGWAQSDVVVLARADDPADALAGSALAGAHDAPLLITPSDRVPPDVVREVRRLQARKVFVLGGSNAIGDAVPGQLRRAGVDDVVRVSGATRYGTAAAIGELLDAPRGGTVLVVGSWPDALGVSSVAAERARAGTPWPILIAGTELPPETSRALAALDPSRVVLVGGPAAISQDVERTLRGEGYDVERRSGATRYETSRHVAAMSRNETVLVVATGAAFPDGLSAGPLAARLGGTLALVPPDADAPEVDFVRDLADARDLVLVGGRAAIGDSTERALRVAFGSRPSPSTGGGNGQGTPSRGGKPTPEPTATGPDGGADGGPDCGADGGPDASRR